jgi:hypothetical protein
MRPMSSLKPLLCAVSRRCSLAASSSSDREDAAATRWLTADVWLLASVLRVRKQPQAAHSEIRQQHGCTRLLVNHSSAGAID